jgi:hypothetical protein
MGLSGLKSKCQQGRAWRLWEESFLGFPSFWSLPPALLHLHNKKRLVLHSLLHSDLSCASLFPVRKEDITRGPPGLSRIIFQETSVYLLEVCWTVSAINLLSSFPVALWVYSVLNSATYILVMFQGDWE